MSPIAPGAPGWFGKLPGMGDFAHRRLPEAFRLPWDAWLQEGLGALRQRRADWTARYLESPLWCFALGGQLAGAGAWVGVLMPSVDSVGRYFPFTLATGVAAADCAAPEEARNELHQWWAWAAGVALQALEQDFDPGRLDAALQAPRQAIPAAGSDTSWAWPAAGASLWFTDPAGPPQGWRLRCQGLPRGERFDALFGCADEATTREMEAAA